MRRTRPVVSATGEVPSCTVSGTVIRNTETQDWNPPGGGPAHAANAPSRFGHRRGPELYRTVIRNTETQDWNPAGGGPAHAANAPSRFGHRRGPELYRQRHGDPKYRNPGLEPAGRG